MHVPRDPLLAMMRGIYNLCYDLHAKLCHAHPGPLAPPINLFTARVDHIHAREIIINKSSANRLQSDIQRVEKWPGGCMYLNKGSIRLV